MKEDFSYINQYKDHLEGRAFRKQPVAVFSEGASWRWGKYLIQMPTKILAQLIWK